MIQPYNIISWSLVTTTIIISVLNMISIHVAIVMLLACIMRFIGVDRTWTAIMAICACAVSIPSIIFLLSGDYIHVIVIMTALTNIMPMFRFAINGKLKVLYSGF